MVFNFENKIIKCYFITIDEVETKSLQQKDFHKRILLNIAFNLYLNNQHIFLEHKIIMNL